MTARVLITNQVPADHLAPLDRLAEIVQGPGNYQIMSRSEVLRLAPTLIAIINQAELRVDAELLDAAPQLKIVANVAIGTDNLDKDLMARRGVWATNVPDAFVESAADCTLGMLLCLVRRLHEADRYVRADQWQGFRPGEWDGMELRGKSWGIVGYGKIGRAVADRARAFGVTVLIHDPALADRPEHRSLQALLRESDIVSLHVPLVPATRGLINRDRLAGMKRGAILINMARGPVMIEQDVVDSLRSGQLGGAALDVFEHEPKVHPDLKTMSNVVLTPHLGGGTRESRRAARLACAENVAAVLQGRCPPNAVNTPVGQEDRP